MYVFCVMHLLEDGHMSVWNIQRVYSVHSTLSHTYVHDWKLFRQKYCRGYKY
jgi:hypothetical protein